MIKSILPLAALMLFAGPVLAETDASKIPPKSLETLQLTLARLNELLWEQSDTFFHRGDYDRSIATMKLVVSIDPTDIDAYADASWLLDSRGRPAEAVALLNQGITANPGRYELYADMGHLYYNDGEYAKAAPCFAKAVALPNCPVVEWHILAHSYERSGDLQKSIETWQHAEKLEPDEVVVKNNLKRVEEKLAKQNEGKKQP